MKDDVDTKRLSLSSKTLEEIFHFSFPQCLLFTGPISVVVCAAVSEVVFIRLVITGVSLDVFWVLLEFL